MADYWYIIWKIVFPTGDDLAMRQNIKPILINPLQQHLMSLEISSKPSFNSLFILPGFLLKTT